MSKKFKVLYPGHRGITGNLVREKSGLTNLGRKVIESDEMWQHWGPLAQGKVSTGKYKLKLQTAFKNLLRVDSIRNDGGPVEKSSTEQGVWEFDITNPGRLEIEVTLKDDRNHWTYTSAMYPKGEDTALGSIRGEVLEDLEVTLPGLGSFMPRFDGGVMHLEKDPAGLRIVFPGETLEEITLTDKAGAKMKYGIAYADKDQLSYRSMDRGSKTFTIGKMTAPGGFWAAYACTAIAIVCLFLTYVFYHKSIKEGISYEKKQEYDTISGVLFWIVIIVGFIGNLISLLVALIKYDWYPRGKDSGW